MKLNRAYLLSFDYVKLHSFSISNTAKVFSRVVLFDSCLKTMNSSDVRFYIHYLKKIKQGYNNTYNLPGVQKRPLLCHS